MIIAITLSTIMCVACTIWLYGYAMRIDAIQSARENVSNKAFIAVNIWACRKSGKWIDTEFSEAMDELHRATAEYLALDH